MIYLDSGATTLQKPKQVFRAVQKAMESCANPGRSGHKPAREAERVVYSCREEAAERIGVAASTIGNYERGTSFPNVPVLRRIEEVYGVAYENLVFQTAAPDPSQP